MSGNGDYAQPDLSTQAQVFVKNKVDEGSFINHHKSLSFS